VSLGDANGLKQWLEARLIAHVWPYRACINGRSVAVALKGAITSAEAAALGASARAARPPRSPLRAPPSRPLPRGGGRGGAPQLSRGRTVTHTLPPMPS